MTVSLSWNGCFVSYLYASRGLLSLLVLADPQDVVAPYEDIANAAAGFSLDDLLCVRQLDIEVVVRGHERALVLCVVELQRYYNALAHEAAQERFRVDRDKLWDIVSIVL